MTACVLLGRGYDEELNLAGFLSTLFVIELAGCLALYGYGRNSLALVGCHLIIVLTVLKDVVHFVGTDVTSHKACHFTNFDSDLISKSCSPSS